MQYSESPIAVVGLGYVGLPLAVEFGTRRKVIGFDTNDARIKELKKGIDNTLETTNQELKDAVDNNMPYDHIKFLVDDLAVLIRELQNAG